MRRSNQSYDEKWPVTFQPRCGPGKYGLYNFGHTLLGYLFFASNILKKLLLEHR